MAEKKYHNSAIKIYLIKKKALLLTREFDIFKYLHTILLHLFLYIPPLEDFGQIRFTLHNLFFSSHSFIPVLGMK